MARFHFFDEALKNGFHEQKGPPRYLAITGRTITNEWKVKEGRFKVADKPVVKKVFKRLKKSEPHYVLLTDEKPQGRTGIRFEEEIATVLETTNKKIDALTLPELPDAKCWYTYWRGPLKKRFGRARIEDPPPRPREHRLARE